MDDSIVWEEDDDTNLLHNSWDKQAAINFASAQDELLFADESDEYLSDIDEEEDFTGGVESDEFAPEAPHDVSEKLRVSETPASATSKLFIDDDTAGGVEVSISNPAAWAKKRAVALNAKREEAETKKRLRYVKHRSRVRRIERHKLSLLSGLALSMSLSDLCNHPIITNRLKAELPDRVRRAHPYNTRQKLMVLLNWFTGAFELQDGPGPHRTFREYCSEDHIRHIIWCTQEHTADPLTYILLVTCALRDGNGPVRLVKPISSYSFKRITNTSELDSSCSNNSTVSKDWSWTSNLIWIELPIVSQSNQIDWMMVDPLTVLVTKNHYMGFAKVVHHRSTGTLVRDSSNSTAASGTSMNTIARKMPYIVAIGPIALDVSPRYYKDWSTVSLHRLPWDNEWWNCQVLDSLNSSSNVANTFTSSELGASWSLVSSAGLREERAQLSMLVRSNIPKSLDAIKKHPDLFLEEQLRKDQSIVPGATPVGFHSGSPLYRASDVQWLLSRNKWRVRGRNVKDSELQFPFKYVKRRTRGSTTNRSLLAGNETLTHETETQASQSGPSPEDSGKIKLYGEWQTEAIHVDDVGPDGKIARNEFGNVEMLSLALLPKGATHLSFAEHPHATQAASNLEIDAAPALVGFDYQYERTRPRFDGVIVATFNVPKVLAECKRVAAELAKEAAAAKFAAVCKTWVRLARAILIAAEIKERYQNPKRNNNEKKRKSGDESTIKTKKQNRVAIQNHASVCQHQFESLGTDTSEEQCKLCGTIQEVM